MAPEQTRPQFSPDAQARRDHKAQRDERFKAAVVETMDIGKGYTADAGSRALDGGEQLAVAAASRAAASGRRLSAPERREVRERVLAGQVQLTPEQWLARFAGSLPNLTDEQLVRLDQTATFAKLPPKLQARVRGLLDQEDERRLAENYGVDYPPPSNEEADEEELGPNWLDEVDEQGTPAGDEDLLGYANDYDEGEVGSADDEDEVSYA